MTTKKVQSTFLSLESTTCTVCGMTFYKHVQKDKNVHAKYHSDFINGLPWKNEHATSLRSIPVSIDHKSIHVTILDIDRALARQVKKVDKLLEMVNRELNAPAANQSWKSDQKRTISDKIESTDAVDPSPIAGKAYVILAQSRAIGLVVTEPIVDVEAQAKWMVHRTQDIVPNQVNRNVRLGISRIWVAPKWRRCGLANHLLQVVLKHSVFGMPLKPHEVAFSQPTHAGGLLAKSFNGVKHKSGEVLVPIYLES